MADAAQRDGASVFVLPKLRPKIFVFVPVVPRRGTQYMADYGARSPPPGGLLVSDGRRSGVSWASRHKAEAVAGPEARALRGPHVTRQGAVAGPIMRALRRLPPSGNAVRPAMEPTMSDIAVAIRPTRVA